jgi:hypothetical protein
LKFYGPLEIAGAEVVAADPTTHLWVGRLIFNSSDAKYKVYNLGVWREIIEKASDAETIAGTVDTKYMAPSNLEAWWLSHRADLATAQSGLSNDHLMTPLRTSDHLLAKTATTLEAQSGVTNLKVMSPLRTQEFLTSRFASLAESQAGVSTIKVTNPKGVADYVTNRLADLAQAQAGTDNVVLSTPLRVADQTTARLSDQSQAQLGTDNNVLMTPWRTTQLVNARIATDAEAAAGSSATALMTPRGVNIFFASAASSILNSAFVSAAMYSAGIITIGATTITSATNVYIDDPTESSAPVDLGTLNIDFSAHVAPNPVVPWIAYADVDWAGGPPTAVITVAARSGFANAASRYVLFTSDRAGSILSGPRGYSPNQYNETITVPFQGGKNALVAEADWGTAFGHKLQYLKSNAANPALAGIVRLGNTENISWRNAANSADLSITIGAGDRLLFEGVIVPTLSSTDTFSNKTHVLPRILDGGSDHSYIFAVADLAADRNVSLPLLISNDTFVFEAHIQTLTNKTLTNPTVTTGSFTSPVLITPRIQDSGTDHNYIFSTADLAADRTVSLPLLTGNDTFVFEGHAQTLTNKTLTNPTVTTGLFTSPVFITPRIQDSGADHNYIFSTADLAADRNISLPLLGSNDTFVFEAHAQTLTNKTLTNPTVTTGSFTSPTLLTPRIQDAGADNNYIFSVADLAADRTISLPLLGANDTFVFEDHTQTLTNKTLTSPVLTTPQINDNDLSHQYTILGGALTANVNVSLPAMSTADTLVMLSLAQTLVNKTLKTASFIDSDDSHSYVIVPSNLAANRNLTLPLLTADDTFAVTTLAQTLSNKTLASPIVTGFAQFNNQAEIRLLEQTGNGTNYVALLAPDALAGNVSWKLPNADGLASQLLGTDGSGNLGWYSGGGGGTDIDETSTGSFTVDPGKVKQFNNHEFAASDVGTVSSGTRAIFYGGWNFNGGGGLNINGGIKFV